MCEKEILKSLINGKGWSSESGVGKVSLKKVLDFIEQLEKEKQELNECLKEMLDMNIDESNKKQELKEWLEEEIKHTQINVSVFGNSFIDRSLAFKEVLKRLG